MRRQAFTLVELLVTVTIIAILATFVLGMVATARESARDYATRATLAKLDGAVNQIWEETYARRLPARVNLMSADARKQQANMRRELAKIEMPDRWTDVTDPFYFLPASYSYQDTMTGELIVTPAVSRAQMAYRTALTQAIKRLQGSGLTPEQIDGKLRAWQSAECLYLVVSTHCANRIDWTEHERGDLDNDGLYEIHDGWGRPIAWIRWAVGFPGCSRGAGVPTSEAWGIEPFGDYPAHRSAEEMGPRPLIYSAGSDGQYDINRGVQDDGSGGWEIYAYRPDANANLNAWALDGNDHWIGEPLDSTSPAGEPIDGHLNHHDNLTNYNYNE